MTDFTPQEIAEKLIALGDQLPSYIKPVMTVITAGAEDKDAVNQAASYLRKIAAGEYKRVVHAHITGHGYDLHCSNCGASADIGDDYCKSCGALMDGKDDSR